MGDTAVNVGLNVETEWHPDGSIGFDCLVAVSGLHWRVNSPTDRAALRAMSGAPDPDLRAALVAVPSIGAAGGRVWDDTGHQDALHGPSVPGYAPIRPRLRACLAALP